VRRSCGITTVRRGLRPLRRPTAVLRGRTGTALLIRFASEMGFTLSEIKIFLNGLRDDAPGGPRWKKLAHRKIQEVEDGIRRSRRLKSLLEHLLHCQCISLQVCVKRLSPSLRLIGRDAKPLCDAGRSACRATSRERIDDEGRYASVQPKQSARKSDRHLVHACDTASRNDHAVSAQGCGNREKLEVDRNVYITSRRRKV
jgi:MerR, DNA binding